VTSHAIPLSASLQVVRHCARGIVALACLAFVGCGYFPEASFWLSSDSRLPNWFKLVPGQTRANVTVTMDYYLDSSGRTATFTLRDSNGLVTSKVTGNLKGLEPLHRGNNLPGHPEGYPSYEIITVGGISEIVEHRRLEPVFYVTDDPAVLAEFTSHA
jgi:hypothetical protein